MKREELAHILRAAADVTGDGDILVIGSQAILASYEESELPLEATASIEADIAFLDDEKEEKADRVDGAIGEASMFHETNGYYGQGVSVSTAVLPTGWEDRVVRFVWGDPGKANAVCLDPHDLVLAKLAAGREKDIDFARALMRHKRVEASSLIDRLEDLPVPGAVRRRIRRFIDSERI